jgi:hypothetical protein
MPDGTATGYRPRGPDSGSRHPVIETKLVEQTCLIDVPPTHHRRLQGYDPRNQRNHCSAPISRLFRQHRSFTSILAMSTILVAFPIADIRRVGAHRPALVLHVGSPVGLWLVGPCDPSHLSGAPAFRAELFCALLRFQQPRRLRDAGADAPSLVALQSVERLARCRSSPGSRSSSQRSARIIRHNHVKLKLLAAFGFQATPQLRLSSSAKGT